MLSSIGESQLVLEMHDMQKFHHLLFFGTGLFIECRKHTSGGHLWDPDVPPHNCPGFLQFRHEEDTAKSEQWAESRQRGLNILFLLGSVLREAAPLESRMKRNDQKLGQWQTWMSGTQDYWDKSSLMMLFSHFTGFKTPLFQYKKYERWIYFSKCFREIKH